MKTLSLLIPIVMGVLALAPLRADQQSGPAREHPRLTGRFPGATGGEWTVMALPRPGEPVPRITGQTSGTMRVSWPASLTGHRLVTLTNRAAFNLTRVPWTNCRLAVQTDGTNRFVQFQPVAGDYFFRLVRTNLTRP